MCGFYYQNLVLFSRHLEAEFFKKKKNLSNRCVVYRDFLRKIQNPKISDLIRKYPIFVPISSTWERVQEEKLVKYLNVVSSFFSFENLIRKNPINSDFFQINCQSSEVVKNSTFFYWPVAISRVFFVLFLLPNWFFVTISIFFSSNYSTTLLNKSFSFSFSQGHRRGRSGQMATFHGIGGIILLWRLLRPRCVRLLRLCTIQVNFYESYIIKFCTFKFRYSHYVRRPLKFEIMYLGAVSK